MKERRRRERERLINLSTCGCVIQLYLWENTQFIEIREFGWGFLMLNKYSTSFLFFAKVWLGESLSYLCFPSSFCFLDVSVTQSLNLILGSLESVYCCFGEGGESIHRFVGDLVQPLGGSTDPEWRCFKDLLRVELSDLVGGCPIRKGHRQGTKLAINSWETSNWCWDRSELRNSANASQIGSNSLAPVALGPFSFARSLGFFASLALSFRKDGCLFACTSTSEEMALISLASFS